MENQKEFNPRFVAYSRLNGNTPEIQIEKDKMEYPGGCMAGFIIWIDQKLREYKSICPRAFIGLHLSDHDGFTTFLQNKS